MKKSMKKLTALLLVTAIITTMAGNVYAVEPKSKVYIQVSGCDTVIEIEPFIAEIDGEECVVIDLNGLLTNGINLSSNNNFAQCEENVLGISTLDNKRRIYSDTVNLSKGDYSSPEINCSPAKGFVVRMKSAIIAHKIRGVMHLYNNNFNHFLPSYDFTMTFSLAITENQLVLLEPASDISKCRLEIFKDGTDISNPFSYTLFEY